MITMTTIDYLLIASVVAEFIGVMAFAAMAFLDSSSVS